MALIAQSDIEAKIGRSLTAEEVNAFTIINAALQAHVENLIGSSVESVSATTRYYDGGVQHLLINPCTSITAVKQVDDDYVVIDTYDTSDYTVDPVNDTLKLMIRHRNNKGFITGINNIAVTAKFSINEDTNTLNIVKNSLIEAIVAELDNSENIKAESIEGYSIQYASSEAKDALSPIKYLFPGV